MSEILVDMFFIDVHVNDFQYACVSWSQMSCQQIADKLYLEPNSLADYIRPRVMYCAMLLRNLALSHYGQFCMAHI